MWWQEFCQAPKPQCSIMILFCESSDNIKGFIVLCIYLILSPHLPTHPPTHTHTYIYPPPLPSHSPSHCSMPSCLWPLTQHWKADCRVLSGSWEMDRTQSTCEGSMVYSNPTNCHGNYRVGGDQRGEFHCWISYVLSMQRQSSPKSGTCPVCIRSLPTCSMHNVGP